jgi:ABC-type Fe3+-citrate transport system substrate-binding protein
MTSHLTGVPAPFARSRVSAAQREQRRFRIMGLVQAGVSYEAIARQEQITGERVRQIVRKSLETQSGETRPDPNLLQIARLEPALRLASMGVVNGDLKAIAPLLRVLERLDKYGAVVRRSRTTGSSFTSG